MRATRTCIAPGPCPVRLEVMAVWIRIDRTIVNLNQISRVVVGDDHILFVTTSGDRFHFSEKENVAAIRAFFDGGFSEFRDVVTVSGPERFRVEIDGVVASIPNQPARITMGGEQ